MKYLWIVSIYNSRKASSWRLAITAPNLHDAEAGAKDWLNKDERVQQVAKLCATQGGVNREI